MEDTSTRVFFVCNRVVLTRLCRCFVSLFAVGLSLCDVIVYLFAGFSSCVACCLSVLYRLGVDLRTLIGTYFNVGISMIQKVLLQDFISEHRT